MKIAEQKALIKAIRERDAETIKNLLDDTNLLEGECTINSSIYTYTNGRYGTLLEYAIVHYKDEIVKLLGDRGADLSKLSSNSLFDAIKSNNPEAVAFLCNAGVNVNVKDSYGMTPLIRTLSYINNDTSIIDILINHGADINANITFTNPEHRITPEYPTYKVSTNILQKAMDYKNYDAALHLIDLGADVNFEFNSLGIDGSIISRYTPLYQAIRNADLKNEIEKDISLICKLLAAGADPNIPVHLRNVVTPPRDDTVFKLALRSERPELIDAICSVLFKQNSLTSLYNIITLTLESLELNNGVNDILLQYYQKDGWSYNIEQKAEAHIDEINKVKDREGRVFKNLIDMPYNLGKTFNVIKERFPDAFNLLPQEFAQSCLRDVVTSTIRIYSEKYAQSFSSQVIQPIQPKPSIVEKIKAHVISFLPLEEQWDAIMLSKGGLEDPLFPEQEITGLSAKFAALCTIS